METLYRRCRRAGALLTVLAMLLGLFPLWALADDTESAPTPDVTFTFTDSGITASDSTAGGYSIDGTALTISEAGTYALTGSCGEGSVAVKSGTSGVVLVLDDLTLACSTSAPLVCKKTSSVTLWLSGQSTLTDAENPEDETSTDTAAADAFEGAAIKVKSGASLLIKGSGTLNVDGSACKNGIKGGAESTVTVSGGTLSINAANNGLAADGSVVIKGGTLNISAANDGIKASPDEDDTASAGTVTIYDGTFTIDADSDGINAAGDITIYGGTFDIQAASDGIQTDSSLTIADGDFSIQTLDGYNSSSFSSDTMSCKGLKASADDEETENTVTVTGGTFVLNTADDAVHSDDYVKITGGKFTIQTGDDGVHADTSLILGTEGGTAARDPDITVLTSYEGLEAGTVYLYSGRYSVRSSDDGINAAGGSGSGSDPGGPGGFGGGDSFNPGGGMPGGGMPGGGRLMGGGFNGAQPVSFGGEQNRGGMRVPGSGGEVRMGRGGMRGQNGNPGMDRGGGRLMADTGYSLNIAGGNVYVNADGDGLDSNGDISLTGGNIEVWGMSSGDNEPLDYETTLTVSGATVFAAGCAGMGVASPASGSQGYTSYGGSSGGGRGGWGGSSGNSIASGSLITVSNGSSTVYQANSPKAVSYIFYSDPDTTGSYSISSGTGTASCQYGNDWTHSWDSGVVTTAATAAAAGVRTYTCSVCGAAETETIPMLVTIPADSDGDTGDTTDTGYTVTFSADGNCSINVYHTQDYAAPDETNVTETLSRNADTGEPDSTGDGQVNFLIVPAGGYTVDSVTVTEGTYKNLKGPADTGVENLYRITKITADTTVTVTTAAAGDDTGDDTGDTDTGYTVTFSADENCSINVYYTQDYTAPDETNVTETVSRNSDTGEPDSTGDGQVNFLIVPAGGYSVDSVTVTEGTYKNLKGPADTGVENLYRITKITADTTVTVTTAADDTGDDSDTEYTVTVTNGTGSGTYQAGSQVSISADTPEDGRTFDRWLGADGLTFISGNQSTAEAVFTMPEGAVTLEASFRTQSQTQGCYVATAVYGSYDCPEVWTLRRFRDGVLAKSWYGRLFIRLYYAVSPAAVRLFGDAPWFRNFWRDRLDKMVAGLQADGFASTPYQDRDW